MNAPEFRVIAGPAYWAARAAMKARQIHSENRREKNFARACLGMMLQSGSAAT